MTRRVVGGKGSRSPGIQSTLPPPLVFSWIGGFIMWGTKKLAGQAVAKSHLALSRLKEVVMEIARLWSAINSQAERIEELEARVSLLDDVVVGGAEDYTPLGDTEDDEDADDMSDEDFHECLERNVPEPGEAGPSLKRSLRRPGSVEGGGQ